jgi:hypothetical protein
MGQVTVGTTPRSSVSSVVVQFPSCLFVRSVVYASDRASC